MRRLGFIVAPAFAAAACLPSLPAKDPGEICGDGWWSPLEVCEPADPVYGPWCKADCTWNTCGDGVVGPDEGCDPPQADVCAENCQAVGCGNGAAEPGELCLDATGVVPLGPGAADLALHDLDDDGDPDLLVAEAAGISIHWNDAGQFARSGLLFSAPGARAVAGVGDRILGLTPEALVSVGWAGTQTGRVDQPILDCESPRPGTLWAAAQGVVLYAAMVCDEKGLQAFLPRLDDPSPFEVGGGVAGVVGAVAIPVERNDVTRSWFAASDEAQLLPIEGVPLDLSARPLALRQPAQTASDGLTHVAVAEDRLIGFSLDAVVAERATPGVVDGALLWWNTDSRLPEAIAGLWTDGARLRLTAPDGALVEGPTADGLTRLLVADLDRDGLLDVIAHRPAAGEALVWRQVP